MQYIHIIRGEELYRLARDYTRYMVTGKRTARLKRAMLSWRDFSESITKETTTEDQLLPNPRGGNSPNSSFVVSRSSAEAICARTRRNRSSEVALFRRPLSFPVVVM